MKKLLLFAILFFVFTGMKVVYKNDTGEITAIGPLVDYVPQDGQSVLDDPDAIPEQFTTHKIKSGKFKPKTQAEVDSDETKKQQKKDKHTSDKASAITKLKASGLTDDELTAIGLK